MKNITIREVSGKKGTDEFIDVVWKIYDQKTYPTWVPPLRMAVYEALDTVKNPFFKRASLAMYIAEKNGQVVGRIAAIENKAHNEFHNDKAGFYGFYEAIEDQDVANALFQEAEKWLKARGLTSMMGPMNPSTNHECGLLVRGQSQHPTCMTTWNPKYFEAQHDQYGLTKAKDLVAYIVKREKNVELPEKVQRYVKKLRAENSRVIFRDFDVKNFDAEVDKCYEVYNSAWEKNWGFFPMTHEEFKFAAKDMKMFLDPKMAFMAEVDGKPAGFMLAMPDFNHILKRIPSGKLLPTGIFTLLIGKLIFTPPTFIKKLLRKILNNQARTASGSRNGPLATAAARKVSWTRSSAS